MLATLACTFLGALLLSACSNTTNNPPGVASLSALTQEVSPTQQGEGDAQLQTFQQWIMLMQQNGGDVSTYQLEYNSDQQALVSANTAEKYSTVLNTLNSHVQTIKLPAMKQECLHLQQHLQQQVRTWGTQHTFHDSYNGRTYALGYQYDNATGVGGPVWLQEELQADRTLADYQQTVEDLNMWIYNFQQMRVDAGDTTPFNQIHQADLNLLNHYGYMDERVVVVSLVGESLRAYDHGKLVNAFQVTTGQPDLPSPPGNWWIEGKKHPTVFKSTAPKGSPEWYPDTPINYAMQYHSNGYFFHDAWWRTQFGPGTNFPHLDPNGDPFAGQGSHGCVNMSTTDAAWLYDFVSVFTNIVIY
jgi:hypothetical protein